APVREIERQRIARPWKRQQRRRPQSSEALQHGQERALPRFLRRMEKRWYRLARRFLRHHALMLEEPAGTVKPVPVANAVERKEKALIGGDTPFRRAPRLPAVSR